MMLLEQACVLLVPKTGGTWVRAALKASTSGWEEYSVAGKDHVGLDLCPCPEKFKIAFVRHPIEMYRSYWQYKMGSGWDPTNALDRGCARDDFGAFVDRVLETYPGVVGALFEQFVGPPDHPIEFVGRAEHLADDLVAGLRRAGQPFDEAALRAVPPRNVSLQELFPARLSPERRARLVASEASTFARFGYPLGELRVTSYE